MMVAVIGAAGMTGEAIVRCLAASGVSVRAVVRRADVRVADAAETAIADLRDHAGMETALTGCDVVVHVAGILLGRDLARIRAIKSAAALVVVSSASVRSRHRVSARAYLEGEDAILRVRPDAVIVRPTMIYGTGRDKNVHHVLLFAQRYRFLPLFGDGLALVQPIHFEDLAEAIAVLARSAPAGGRMDAGGGTAISVRDALNAVFAVLGMRPKVLPVPIGPATALARSLDAFRGGRLAERVLRFTEDRSADNSTLIERTGVQPRSFHAGIRDEARLLGLV